MDEREIEEKPLSPEEADAITLRRLENALRVSREDEARMERWLEIRSLRRRLESAEAALKKRK